MESRLWAQSFFLVSTLMGEESIIAHNLERVWEPQSQGENETDGTDTV